MAEQTEFRRVMVNLRAINYVEKCGHNFPPKECPYQECGYREALVEVERLRKALKQLAAAVSGNPSQDDEDELDGDYEDSDDEEDTR